MGGKIVANLTGRINKTGVISPRFDVGIRDIEKWTNNLLPSRQFGFIVMTTSSGIMTHEASRRQNSWIFLLKNVAIVCVAIQINNTFLYLVTFRTLCSCISIWLNYINVTVDS